MRLIAEQGIEKLTFRNLAAMLGVSEPAFYRHFRSKSDMLMAILECFDGVRRRLFADLRDGSADSLAAVEAIISRHLDLFERNRTFVTLLFPEEMLQGREELQNKVREMMGFGRGQIARIVEEGIARGEIRPDLDPDQIALLVSGSLRLIVTCWRLNKFTGDLREEGARLWRTLSSLIRPSAAGAPGAGGTSPPVHTPHRPEPVKKPRIRRTQ